MSDKLETLITEIKRYTPLPNEVFIITIKSDDVDERVLASVRKKFADILGDTKLVVLGIGLVDSVDFSVVKKSQIDSEKTVITNDK